MKGFIIVWFLCVQNPTDKCELGINSKIGVTIKTSDRCFKIISNKDMFINIIEVDKRFCGLDNNDKYLKG